MTGTAKNPCPTNIAKYVERPGLEPVRIDGSRAPNIEPIISAERTDIKTIPNANFTDRVWFMGI
tara:strand:- start:2568 stop:2759 length:192 start_codon:yes stop_codon:yes gene_type:complete